MKLLSCYAGGLPVAPKAVTCTRSSTPHARSWLPGVQACSLLRQMTVTGVSALLHGPRSAQCDRSRSHRELAGQDPAKSLCTPLPAVEACAQPSWQHANPAGSTCRRCRRAAQASLSSAQHAQACRLQQRQRLRERRDLKAREKASEAVKPKVAADKEAEAAANAQALLEELALDEQKRQAAEEVRAAKRLQIRKKKGACSCGGCCCGLVFCQCAGLCHACSHPAPACQSNTVAHAWWCRCRQRQGPPSQRQGARP